jgi:para-nitrobenzyl esterase
MFDRHHIVGLFTVFTLLISVACGSDDDDDGSAGSGGSAAGAGGAGGTGGAQAGAGAGGSEAVYTEEIQTASGPVRGTVSDGVRKFMGIPFAADTGGDNRWKPPQPVTEWTETLDAVRAGPICPQDDTVTHQYDPDSDEDCLYLNVWAPDPAPSSPLPVMVWIFPGAFVFGSGSDPAYDGGNLVRDGEVVVVSMNYRLGALGFMAHAGLSAENADGTSGNYGLLDQQAALHWVQDNIEAFGGDRDNVTIFGESAGAHSTMLHLVMPGSQGLFHKAIIQSGLALLPLGDLDYGEQQGARFAAAMGCDQQDDAEALDCLRALSAEQIVAGPEQAADQLPGGIFYQDQDTSLMFRIVVDDTHITGQPRQLYTDGQAAAVPVLHGTNTMEGTIFHIGLFGDTPVENETEYLDALTRTFEDAASEIEAQYPVADYPSANDALIEVSGDALLVCPARAMARLLTEAGVNNYLYSFDLPLVDSIAFALYPELENIAFHAADIPYVFHTEEFLLGKIADQAAADAIMGYWTRFAHTGDPNGGGAVEWPDYDPNTDEILDIGDAIQTTTGHKKDTCDFWEALVESGKL